jgi:hypothetical protein
MRGRYIKRTERRKEREGKRGERERGGEERGRGKPWGEKGKGGKGVEERREGGERREARWRWIWEVRGMREGAKPPGKKGGKGMRRGLKVLEGR